MIYDISRNSGLFEKVKLNSTHPIAAKNHWHLPAKREAVFLGMADGSKFSTTEKHV